MLVTEVAASMRILAFHFVDRAAADATVADLRGTMDDPAHDIRTAPVSVDGADGVIVGLTADQDARDPMIKLVAEHGGRLVADVPEEWTDLPRE